ncbi:MAG: hypothetical protein H5T61_09580 [Thermoflexales bacterium]|nr:hypothetical protein [Thermoflexales bacterium]
MVVDIVDLDNVGVSDPFEVFKGMVEPWEDTCSCRVLEDLAGSPNPEPEVLLIQPRAEGPTLDDQWLLALERWASAAKRYAPSQRRKLCVVVPADSLPRMPQPDITVAVQRWWGIPSALETRLACRLASQEEGPVSLWREHLIPSLAGNDLALGEYLWDIVMGPEDEILAGLAQYGMERGWQKADAEEAYRVWSPLPPGRREIQLPRQVFSLWARGWIVYTPEYGGEIHSALVALLDEQNNQEIAHRLWRAQTPLLLPVVDSVRLNICEQLTQMYGRTWTTWVDGWDDASYPELGVIESALRKGNMRESEKHRWLKVVQLTRLIRNKLAHYTPISFQEFIEFWERATPFLKVGGAHVAS